MSEGDKCESTSGLLHENQDCYWTWILSLNKTSKLFLFIQSMNRTAFKKHVSSKTGQTESNI